MEGLPTTPIILCVVVLVLVSRSYVTRLFEVDTDFKNVFKLKFFYNFFFSFFPVYDRVTYPWIRVMYALYYTELWIFGPRTPS